MLPSLGRLPLTRTGGSLAPGQLPEDVTCVICFHSLAEPPPDGENVWPFDDDPVIWIVACNNQHAFHKGCLRAYARDSEDSSRCPECRVPMLPQVLTHVSRPSAGEHAAREAREAAERAEGQERDREDARRREREMRERMQQEFQEMDDEDRRMHAGAYGDQSSSDEDDWDWVFERERQAERQAELNARYRQEMMDAPDEPVTSMADPVRLASDDIALAMQITGEIARASGADRSSSAYMYLAHVIGRCIARGSRGSGNDEYRFAMILELTNRNPMHLTRAWFHSTIVSCSHAICPPALKGQLLRLLAAYADARRVIGFLREMNAQQRGQASWDAAGAFGDAVRRYVDHLQWLGPDPTTRTTDENTFELNTKDSRKIDALRVLHHLKWDPLVRDEWLFPFYYQPIVNEYSEDYQILVAMDRERIIPEARGRVEYLVSTLRPLGAYDEATEPGVYASVKANLRALLDNFRVWHERHPGFDEYPRFTFPFGREVVRLWALANYMHGVPHGLEVDPNHDRTDPERAERYDKMREMLTRLVWLGVTWWIGRPHPANNGSATRDEMEHFFWAYVAPQYKTEDDAEAIFKYEELADLERVINRNNRMRDQWVGDRRSGPWFRNLGMDDAERAAERAEREAPRVRAGGETPDARRQRRD